MLQGSYIFLLAMYMWFITKQDYISFLCNLASALGHFHGPFTSSSSPRIPITAFSSGPKDVRASIPGEPVNVILPGKGPLQMQQRLRPLCKFLRAIATKHQKLGGLKQQTFFVL